ncbi:MAG: hypothetical protein K0U54_04630 [Bacteroidetes bacterium]|nr:hypothetical protein [Bacteroidota bacterium]
MDNPRNNLDTFRILYIVKGILTLLFSLFFLAYAFFGVFISTVDSSAAEAPFNISILFGIIGGIGFLFTAIFGILTLLAAKYIKETRNYNFIFVIAVLNCLTGVLGILLGVFTFIELTKPEVKMLFNQTATPATV